MSGEHAPIAPSSLARTMQCPASVKMQALFPEPDGPEAIEGTGAHWAASELLHGHPIAVGQVAPNGVVLTDEMIEGAELFASVVEPHTGACFVETRVPIKRVHAQCWGTPDAFKWKNARTLFVPDYKFGHGFVEVFENPQLMAYAVGALEYSQIDGAAEQGIAVEFAIVQPRNYHRDGPVRTWTVPAVDLRGHVNLMAAAAEEALGDNPIAHVGPECKHCTARRACPTNQGAALNLCDDAGKSIPLELTTPQAANELRRLNYAIDIAEARRTGLEAQLLAAARQGQPVPYFHVEHGQGREKWAVPADQVFALGDLMGANLRAPLEPITPAAARKLGIDMPGFSARAQGAASLVADAPHQAAKVFGRAPA